MKLAVVLGTCNRLDQVQRCVESIVRETKIPTKIYITDAGSTDGTVEYLQSIASETIIPILVGKKLGQAKAYNNVFHSVDTPYVCWLSDDNEVIDQSLDCAVDILERNPAIGMVALKTTDVQGPFVDAPYIGGISSAGILNVNQGVLPTGVMKQAGGFSEEFRDYGIDAALTAEILYSGYNIVYTRQIALRHYRNWSEDPTTENYQWLQERHIAMRERYEKIYGTVHTHIQADYPYRLKTNLAKRLQVWLASSSFGKPLRNTAVARTTINVLSGRYISIFDPLFTLGRKYHLVQNRWPMLMLLRWKILNKLKSMDQMVFRKTLARFTIGRIRNMKIRLLVDGVFFQRNNTTGIARVWKSVLPLLVRSNKFEIYFLDRGVAPDVEGIKFIPFPGYVFASGPVADSKFIQKICDFYNIDLFTSTYYTSPLNTPMIFLAHDMIPELFDFDLTKIQWMEKKVAIAYAQRHLCISHSTRNDLLHFYPEIPSEHVVTAHCGVDKGLFYERPRTEVADFRNKYTIDRPYFLFTGTRMSDKGYKNSQLFFNALSGMKDVGFDIFCVGGEEDIETEILKNLPPGVKCFREELDDNELAAAYSGAIALIYPSLYEGFGLPVIEAMACGCPVITTSHGSLNESAGDAAYLISGFDVDEMREALIALQTDAVRLELKNKGLEHVKSFSWQKMANKLIQQAESLLPEVKSGVYDGFFKEWQRLRKI